MWEHLLMQAIQVPLHKPDMHNASAMYVCSPGALYEPAAISVFIAIFIRLTSVA